MTASEPGRREGPAITPYTEPEWQRDLMQRRTGFPLACPDCGRTECFAPLSRESADGREVHYRACKVCGFQQLADGRSPPYCGRMTAHVCLGHFPTPRKCRGCNTDMRAGQPWHLCARVLEPDEARECPECHTVVAERHVIPWAVATG